MQGQYEALGQLGQIVFKVVEASDYWYMEIYVT